MPKFIVYACPVGELAEQLAIYFAKSRLTIGSNTAHHYMPHCTLTGFFEDTTRSVPQYTQTLTRSFKRFQRSQPDPVLEVQKLSFRADWHGLELSSEWLRRLITDFVCTATSPTRKSSLRPKEWLHLSLAYDFTPDQDEALRSLAQSLVHPDAPVAWELRFYQRNSDQSWICHQCLPLQ